MKRRSRRAGEAARILLVFAFLFLAVPVGLVSLAILGYFTTAARAQDQRQQAVMAQTRAHQASRAQQASVEAARRQVEDALRETEVNLPAPGMLRSATEHNYRVESYEDVTPYQDPESGETKTKTTVYQRLVPVQSTRFTRSQVAARQDPAVPRLVGELRDMNEEDEKYEQKLGELRQRLDLEFTGMHEEQSKEIAAVEERLEALKKLHQHRGENRDKIVQRRIDELLGRRDALAWEVDPKGPQLNEPRLGAVVWDNLIKEVDPRGPQLNRPQLSQPQPSQPPAPIGQSHPRFLPGPPDASARRSTQPNAGWRPAVPDHTPPSAYRAPSPYAPGPPFPPMAPLPSQPAPAITLPPSTNRPKRVEDRLMEEVERTIVMDAAGGRFDASPSDANSSVISRIFDVVRKLGAAEAAQRGAELELAHRTRLREKGALPITELQKTEANVAQIRREVKLSQLELEALAESMRRSQKFAETQLKNALAAREVAETRVREGTAPTGDLIRAESEATAAREKLEEAAANLIQLDRARELIRDNQNQPDDADGEQESAEDSREESGDKEDDAIIGDTAADEDDNGE